MTTTEQHFATAYELHGPDDFKALHQSAYTTALRHAVAADIIPPAASLLDVACGTGLLLETLKAQDKLPYLYEGIDIQRWAVEAALQRATRYACTANIQLIQERQLIQRVMVMPKVEVAVCLGLVGYAGVQTAEDILALIRAMKFVCSRMCISVPIAQTFLPDEPAFRRIPRDLFDSLAEEAHATDCREISPVEMMMVWQ